MHRKKLELYMHKTVIIKEHSACLKAQFLIKLSF